MLYHHLLLTTTTLFSTQILQVVQGFNVVPPTLTEQNLLTSSSHKKNTQPRFFSHYAHHHDQRTQLQMGLFDFFKSRENDFVKLEQTSTFGPGPIILLYNIPDGILDEELRDMIDDGISSSKPGEVVFSRLHTSDLESIGEMTVQQVLNNTMEKKLANYSTLTSQSERSVDGSFKTTPIGSNGSQENESYVPILYFSGISNSEMMKTYNIIGREIYEESGGMANAACAKAVAPAMGKSFRRILEEISGDHTDAIESSE